MDVSDMIYDMIGYAVCLLRLGFRLVAVFGRLVQIQGRGSCIQKQKQYAEQYKNTEYTK
jgi:hypothetical protein